jgi:hypothetical protein
MLVFWLHKEGGLPRAHHGCIVGLRLLIWNPSVLTRRRIGRGRGRFTGKIFVVCTTNMQSQPALPLRRRPGGIMHSSLQECQQVRRARVRRHTVVHNPPTLPEYSRVLRKYPCAAPPADSRPMLLL